MVVDSICSGWRRQRPSSNIVVADTSASAATAASSNASVSANPIAVEGEEGLRIAQTDALAQRRRPAVAHRRAPDRYTPPRPPERYAASRSARRRSCRPMWWKRLHRRCLGHPRWLPRSALQQASTPEALAASGFSCRRSAGLQAFPVCVRCRRNARAQRRVVAHAAGVADRSKAEALRWRSAFVARSSFPRLPRMSTTGQIRSVGQPRVGIALGTVRELLSTGPQTVLVIEAPAEPGRSRASLLIPFVSASHRHG